MASNLSEFFRDKRVIILLIFLIISILSISFLGVQQGLDLKGGSSIQLQLEHPVNDSTMKVVTSVLDKRLNLYGVSDVKVRSSGDHVLFFLAVHFSHFAKKGSSMNRPINLCYVYNWKSNCNYYKSYS